MKTTLTFCGQNICLLKKRKGFNPYEAGLHLTLSCLPAYFLFYMDFGMQRRSSIWTLSDANSVLVSLSTVDNPMYEDYCLVYLISRTCS